MDRCSTRAIYRCSNDDCDYRVYVCLDSSFKSYSKSLASISSRSGGEELGEDEEYEDEVREDDFEVQKQSEEDEAVTIRTVQGLHKCVRREELPPRLGIYSTRYLITKVSCPLPSA